MYAKYKKRPVMQWMALLLVVVSVVTGVYAGQAGAESLDPIPAGPAGDSFGMQGKISAPPPTQGATIVTPTTGQNFDRQPVTISGLCPKDLLVRVLVNEVFVGSFFCVDGTFSIEASLFTGQNEIYAMVYDDLDQEGPKSNVVTVTFSSVEFQAFGTLITLTSNFARRAANPGQTLQWPLQLSGGTGPYAVGINWGDNTPPDLKSQPVPGEFIISHRYGNSGIYRVVVKVTDANGVSAFLQLVAVANGKPTAGVTILDPSGPQPGRITKVLWQPAVLILFMAIPAFWLGRRYEYKELRRKAQEDAEKYASAV